MRKLKPFIKEENGMALPVVLSLMLLLSMLVAVAVSSAISVNNSSQRDNKYKRALSAAEAGLQVASYRMNQFSSAQLPTTSCLSDTVVSPTAGECPASTPVSLGNGASYSYRVTPVLGPTGATACAVVPGQDHAPTDRCITAVGTAGGISRRLPRYAPRPGPGSPTSPARG